MSRASEANQQGDVSTCERPRAKQSSFIRSATRWLSGGNSFSPSRRGEPLSPTTRTNSVTTFFTKSNSQRVQQPPKPTPPEAHQTNSSGGLSPSSTTSFLTCPNQLLSREDEANGLASTAAPPLPSSLEEYAEQVALCLDLGDTATYRVEDGCVSAESVLLANNCDVQTTAAMPGKCAAGPPPPPAAAGNPTTTWKEKQVGEEATDKQQQQEEEEEEESRDAFVVNEDSCFRPLPPPSSCEVVLSNLKKSAMSDHCHVLGEEKEELFVQDEGLQKQESGGEGAQSKTGQLQARIHPKVDRSQTLGDSLPKTTVSGFRFKRQTTLIEKIKCLEPCDVASCYGRLPAGATTISPKRASCDAVGRTDGLLEAVEYESYCRSHTVDNRQHTSRIRELQAIVGDQVAVKYGKALPEDLIRRNEASCWH
eukprot:GHVS01070229.1.p1 GENE.GHVS01070229.1~~GHVS01070229.1.p1  ORF type:complete len:423 (+),score=94.19 GHVS01070229.1:226-1494(+)